MKRLQLLSFCLIALVSATFTSCETTDQGGDGAARGISSSNTGMTREDVYQWQDRTFRQLAY